MKGNSWKQSWLIYDGFVLCLIYFYGANHSAQGEGETMIIGLTGGIACGKSTVSTYLRQKGIPVVDADVVARQVVEPGSVGLQQIVECFGRQYLHPDGTLNRAMLGERVFSEPDARKQLNQITGPLILAELKQQLQVQAPVIVLDAALLLEEDAYRQLVDVVWVVHVTPEVQLERLMARNHFTLQQAEARIASQMPESQRLLLADAVIDNNGSTADTYEQVDALLQL